MRSVLIALSLCSSLIVSGCWENKSSYLYLMLHPHYLQNVYNQCVETVDNTPLPCQTIIRAQADFTQLENQREQGPEPFGAQIMQMEENTAALRGTFMESQKAFKALKNAPHSLDQLKDGRVAMDKAMDDYNISEEKVLILLSVVAATSSI